MALETLVVFVASIVIFGMIALLLGCYVLAGFVMHPPPGSATTKEDAVSEGANPERDLRLSFREVSFDAVDGVPIRAWYVPAAVESGASLVSVPGGRDHRREFLPFVRSWHEAGLNVLMIDPRGGGESGDDGFGITLGLRESRDVDAAVTWLKRHASAERIGVVGISQGAASAVMAASRNDLVDCVVMMSTGYDLARLFSLVLPWIPAPVGRLCARMLLWRQGLPIAEAWRLEVPQLAAAGQLTQPVLFIHGTDDSVASAESAERLFAEIPSRRKELWLIPGLAHELPHLKEPEESRRRIAAFLVEHLVSPPP